MKKSSLQSLVAYLNGEVVTNLDEIKAEIETELSKGKAKADANRALYADIHDKVMEVLRDNTSGISAQEIADETGIARGKVVYGLSHYWADEIVKDDSGKTVVYRLA